MTPLFLKKNLRNYSVRWINMISSKELIQNNIIKETITEASKKEAYLVTAGLISLQDNQKDLTPETLQAFEFGFYSAFQLFGLSTFQIAEIWEAVLEDAKQDKILYRNKKTNTCIQNYKVV